MDSRKYVILIKNKNRTKDVKNCSFKNSVYSITFHNSKQLYLYNTNQVKYYQIDEKNSISPDSIVVTYDKAYKDGKILSLTEVNTGEKSQMFIGETKEYMDHFNCLKPMSVISDLSDKIIRCNGTIFASIKMIYVYKYYYKVVFKAGLSKIYDKSTLTISKLQNDLPVFSYFKSVADDLKKSSPIHSYLSDIYNNILIDDASIFYNYITNPQVVENKINMELFYPFNFNLSQMKAVQNVFNYNISAIEAPTGNGKTHTILNILINAIVNNQTIAIVSKNNDWLVKIKKTLEDYNLGFLVALLNNSQNTEYFFNNQPVIPDMTSWQRTIKEKSTLKKELKVLENNLYYCLNLKNLLAIKKHELSELEIEYEHFKQTFNSDNTTLNNFSLLNLSQLNRLLADIYSGSSKGHLSLFYELELIWKYDFFYFKTLHTNPKQIELSIQKYIYIKKINALQESITSLKQKIKNQNFETMESLYLSKSMELLKSYLYNRFDGLQNTSFLFENYKNNFFTFIKKHPVILSTPYSLHTNIKEHYIFDYMIFDDASQMDLLTVGIPMAYTRNAVIIGDSKKLDPIVDNSLANRSTKLAEYQKINVFYDAITNNILNSVKNLYTDLPLTLLREHYLSNPKIVGFCNEFFYNNQLIIHTDENMSTQPILLIESPISNKDSVAYDKIENYLQLAPYLNLENEKANDILLLTPFMGEYKNGLNGLEHNTVSDLIAPFNTVEKNIVVLSTVVSEKSRNDNILTELIAHSNLINNAVSKAINRFILVSDGKITDSANSNLTLLKEYINYHTSSNKIIESDINQVFPLLFNDFSKILLDGFANKLLKNLEYCTNDLAHNIIKKVMDSSSYSNYDWTFGLSLNDIIKNTDNLMEEEKNFISNNYFESYFVIYRKSNKLPVLVIDADGYGYHSSNKDSNRRNSSDNFKINIFNKYHLSYLRWNKNSTGKELELINTLDKIKKRE